MSQKNPIVRETAVAGAFYPAKKEQLHKQLENFFSKTKNIHENEKSNAIIAPHAGYIYSGQTAAFAFSRLKKAKTFVILCPNHTGMGKEISISNAQYWETPFGKTEVDLGLGKKIVEKTIAEFDELAHIGEHAVEVQLPFLQYLFGKDFKILPITIATSKFQELKKLGEALFEIEKNEKMVLGIVASSDFTHYEPKDFAAEKDMMAIKKIEELDSKGFHEMVQGMNLSICGFCGITALLEYCKMAGKKKGVLLSYDTSATASGDSSSVVGYAAIKIE